MESTNTVEQVCHAVLVIPQGHSIPSTGKGWIEARSLESTKSRFPIQI